MAAFPPGSISLMCVLVLRWDWHSQMSWRWDRNTDGSKNIFWHKLIKIHITPLLCFFNTLHTVTYTLAHSEINLQLLLLCTCLCWCIIFTVTYYWILAKVYFSPGARNRIVGCCVWMANTAGWDERIRRSNELPKKKKNLCPALMNLIIFCAGAYIKKVLPNSRFLMYDGALG